MLKLLFITILLISLTILCVCDQAITPSEDVEGYFLSGAVIKNLDLDRLSVTAQLKRNDTILTDVVLFIGDDTLTYNSGYYFKIYNSIADLAEGSHYLHLVDGDLFADSVMFSIASDFAITSKIPAGNAPLTPGNLVQIEWSIPTNVDGYVNSSIKIENNYTPDGYSAFVTSGATSTTYNTDAFALPSGELDPGWYYIYVYGYKDSPVPGTNVPTIFPDGLSNSITGTDFSGKFGSIIVTPRDSIQAAIQ